GDLPVREPAEHALVHAGGERLDGAVGRQELADAPRVVAAEVGVERGFGRGGQAVAAAGDAGRAGGVGAVVERAVARGGLAELAQGNVLIPEEDLVSLVIDEVLQPRAAAPLQDQVALALQHLADDDGAVRLRAGPRTGGVAIARGAGVIAQRAGRELAVGAVIPRGAELLRAPAGGAVVLGNLHLSGRVGLPGVGLLFVPGAQGVVPLQRQVGADLHGPGGVTVVDAAGGQEMPAVVE